MYESPPTKKGRTDVPASGTIDARALRQVTAASLLQAEATSLTRRLERAAGAGRRPDSELERLTARRRALSGKLRRELSGARFRGSFKPGTLYEPALQAHAEAISHLLLWCHNVSVPVMAEGINQTPGTPGTSGEIGTAGLFGGGLAFGGEPDDAGTQAPNTEKWWIHNWNCQVEFPAAAADGVLSYRFTVDNSTNIYHAPANSGSVRTFVTVGTTGDTAQAISNWSTVGWPTDVALPRDFLWTGGSVPVSGTIPVKKGKKAAVGLIFGVIVSVASGYCMFLPTSNFWTRLTLPQGQQAGPGDYGKVEYCVNPHWWYEAILERLKLGS